MKPQLKAVAFAIILLGLTENGVAQNNDFAMKPSQDEERRLNRERPRSREQASFPAPKHSFGIDLLPIVHNLTSGGMQAFIIRDKTGYGAPTSADYYSSHKPIGLFYNLRLGEEKKESNTFLTFGIQGLYETDEYSFIGSADLWHGYKITNSQIGANIGIKWKYILSKHCYLSIGGQLFYGRNRLIVDTTTWNQISGGMSYFHYVDRTYQNVFSGSLNIGLAFHISNRFSVETTLSTGPRYTQTSDSPYNWKRSATVYPGPNGTNIISEGKKGPWPTFKPRSLVFNSRINLILYYKLN